MTARIRRTPLAVVAVLVLAAPAGAQHFAPDAELQSIIQERVEAGLAVGIVLGVMEADGSTRVFMAGEAGPGARPLGSRSVFEIGSMSKVFTGILLAEAVRHGEVALDDPIQSQLPDEVTVPRRGERQITFVDISTHRSALPRMPDNFTPADPTNPYADYTVEQMYEFISRHELRRDIGAEFEYSNLAVGLMGHALARAAGTDYETLVRERILGPLGMSMSGITLTSEMRAWMAKGHNTDGAVVSNWDIPTLAGAGALRSNLDDMFRFLAASLGEPTGDLERSIRVSHQRHTAEGSQPEVGLNWIIRTVGDARVVWHNGGTGGFRTWIGFDPDAGVGAVVLTNSGHGADDIGVHVVNPDVPLSPPQPPNADKVEVEVALSILSEYVGEYQLAPQLIATFTLEDGVLYTQLTGQPRFRIYASSESEFFLKVVEATMRFERDDTGAVTRMVLFQGGQTVPADKIR